MKGHCIKLKILPGGGVGGQFSSSDLSKQSYLPSHLDCSLIQLPLKHWNSPEWHPIKEK